MEDSTIKRIQLTSDAVSENLLEGGGTRRRGKVSKTKTYKIGSITKEGGGSTSPGTMTQLVSSHVPGCSPSAVEPVGIDSSLTQTGAPLQAAGSKPSQIPVKVVLSAAKKKKGKVLLAPAKSVPSVSHLKTRKVRSARKIRMSMNGLSRKIHAAKNIRTKATKDSIEEVKKELQKAGLIKAESKAPEEMLRQMYADFMMLKKRAL